MQLTFTIESIDDARLASDLLAEFADRAGGAEPATRRPRTRATKTDTKPDPVAAYVGLSEPPELAELRNTARGVAARAGAAWFDQHTATLPADNSTIGSMTQDQLHAMIRLGDAFANARDAAATDAPGTANGTPGTANDASVDIDALRKEARDSAVQAGAVWFREHINALPAESRTISAMTADQLRALIAAAALA